MRRPVLLIPLFLALCIVFGWKTYEAWNAPAEDGPIRGSSPASPPLRVAAAEPPPPADLAAAIASIVVRPVFRPDRRPFQENAAVQVPQRNYEAELSRFSLLGVLLMGGVEKAVVTGKGAGPERYEIGPGDPLGGFVAKEIRPDGVVLTADGKEFLLPLYAGSPKGAGPAVRTEGAPSAPAPAGTPAPPAPARTPAASAPSPPGPATGTSAPQFVPRRAPAFDRRRPLRMAPPSPAGPAAPAPAPVPPGPQSGPGPEAGAPTAASDQGNAAVPPARQGRGTYVPG